MHFTTSMDSLRSNIESIRQLKKHLQNEGHVLARDWIEDAYNSLDEDSSVHDASWQSVIKANFEAIAKADVVIVDITNDSTALGYQIAVAVQQKKPTLLVLREGANTPPFTWSIPSSFLSKIEYNDGNIADKVRPFLEENDIKTKDMRFNFFIDRSIYNYLRWAALKSGKTKAEILRNLIKSEIDKKDY